jgi:hypothetical protein
MDAIEIPDWETFQQTLKELRAEYAKESSPQRASPSACKQLAAAQARW